jgi:ABC-2 type transport system ATP-binding protein
VPDQLDLKDLIDRFDGVPLDSIARHPVKLEHIYLEVTRQHHNSLPGGIPALAT